MKLFVGTSGYKYKEWKGTFYPEKLKNDDMLRDYGTKLNSVEINSSFYRMPRRTTLQRWASDVPDHFRFTLKASKRITHERLLRNAEDSVEYLLGLTKELGPKMGPLLFQTHPRLRADHTLLASFLALIPPGQKAAFELQHRSWVDPAVDALLREHDAARVFVHEEKATATPPDELPSTATWGYLRLRGIEYERADLQAWLDKFEALGWQETYAYFKHEEEMTGPEFAEEMLGLSSEGVAQSEPPLGA